MTSADSTVADPRATNPLVRLPKDGVLVSFGATWCSPWTLLQPLLADLEAAGVAVRRVDIDVWPEHAETFRVLTLPTLVWVRDGAERRRLIGAVSAKELKAFTSRK